MKHLIAILWLLGLTLLLCSVMYPAILLGIAQLPFLKDKAEGSLLVGKDGKTIIGSRLEAQAFEEDRYFWPRPSHVSYNGAGSGASNYSANNPALRQRVEFQLGAVLKYGPGSNKKGQMIRDDIEDWFGKEKAWLHNKEWADANLELAKKWNKGLLGTWAENNADLAKGWVKDSELNKKAVKMWKGTPEGKAWLKDKKDLESLSPEDLAVDFFQFYSLAYPGNWPLVTEDLITDLVTKEEKKQLSFKRPHKSCKEIRTYLYPMWREAHPGVDLDPVPADMVTASGSGLDPHITMKSANYQFDRVADAWTEQKKPMAPDEVSRRLRKLVDAHKYAPLYGLAGVDMVNVMELNAALSREDW